MEREKKRKKKKKKKTFSQGVSLFIHPIKILLSTYYVLGIVLSAQEYLRYQEGACLRGVLSQVVETENKQAVLQCMCLCEC